MASNSWLVLDIGKIEAVRPAFHDARNIWPIGYKSVMSCSDGTTFVFEILDSVVLNRSTECKFVNDIPVFKLKVQPRNEAACSSNSVDDSTAGIDEFLGTSMSSLWAQIPSRYEQFLQDKLFGFDSLDVQKRIEGLEGASECEDYEFINTRYQLSRDSKEKIEIETITPPYEKSQLDKKPHRLRGPMAWPMQPSAEVQIRYSLQPKTEDCDHGPNSVSIWLPAHAEKVGKAGGTRWLLELYDGTFLKMRPGDPRLRLATSKTRNHMKSKWAGAIGCVESDALVSVPRSVVDVLELTGMMLSFRSDFTFAMMM
jgi:hypothetical protein